MSRTGLALCERAVLTFVAFMLLSAAPARQMPQTWHWGGIASAASSTFTLDELTIGGPVYRLSFRKITLEGSDLSEEETRKLLAPDDATPLSERLQRLSFAKAHADEVVETTHFGPASGSTIYRDVTLTNVVFGNVGSLGAAGGVHEDLSESVRNGTAHRTAMKGDLGALKVTSLDLVALAKLVADQADEPEPFFTLYKSYRLESYRLKGETDQGEITVSFGPIESQDVRIRPAKHGIGTALEILGRGPNIDRVNEGDRAALIQSVISAIANVEYGANSIRDIDVTMRASVKDGADAGKIKTFHIRAASIESDGQKRSFAVSGVLFEVPEDKVTLTIGRYAIEGFSAEPTLQMLGLMADNGTVSDEDFKNVDPRDLMPGLGSIVLSDIKVTTPEPETSFALGAVKLAFGDQLRGVPTRLSLAIEHFVMALPTRSETPEIKTLREAGLERLDLSAALATKLDQEAKTIELGAVHLDGAGLGTIEFSGTIGNAQPELFTSGASTAQILALALTMKQASLKIVDQGGVDLLAKMVAARERTTTDEVKTEFLASLGTALTETFGDQPQLARVNNAVRKFVAGAKTLTITARSKTELGLGVMDAVTAQTPAEVLKKVEIEARAE